MLESKLKTMKVASGLRTASRILFAAFTVIVIAWLCFYVDSKVQQRRAERFISGLREFPFATADFEGVRELVSKHGGGPMQPVRDSPPFQCTVEHCTFQVDIKPRLIGPIGGAISRFYLAALTDLGLNLWRTSATFTVKRGRLESARIGVLQMHYGDVGDLGYIVNIEQEGGLLAGFQVSKPHVTGPPIELIEAYLNTSRYEPFQRAFDISTRCLTRLPHGCADMAELAPSAWSRLAEAQQ